MTSYKIPANRWIYKLAPHLTGQAQKAYAAMPTEESGKVKKKKILVRYDITKEITDIESERQREKLTRAVENWLLKSMTW